MNNSTADSTVGVADVETHSPQDNQPVAKENSTDEPTRTSTRKARRLGPVLLVIFLAWVGVYTLRNGEAGVQTAEAAPNLVLTTFDGDIVQLNDLRGKGVVLNFWASWCGPCRAEAELLEAAWRQEQTDDVVFVGVNIQDSEAGALAYLEEYRITYPNGADPTGDTIRAYDITGLPETYFIDADGIIQKQVRGPIMSLDAMDQHLELIRP